MKLWLIAFALLLPLVHAAEPPVKEGLILLLDANDVAHHGRAVDRWGITRQIVAGARPTAHAADGEAFVRFDGKDDFLSASIPKRELPEITIVLLAAPKANPGLFSGLLACAPANANDYTAGINIDQGPASTTNLSVINVESAGSGGFKDLFDRGWIHTGNLPFGGFHVFTIRSKAGDKGTELFVDGILAGTRPRSASKFAVEEIIVGGRFYSNDPSQAPFAQGFLNGDIAAALVYDRALSDVEREKAEQALFGRTPKLNALSSGERGHALETVANLPVIQMFAPGFTTHELPIKLSNINNVRYRHDGKLVALGYDGRIHLLTDSDGDGLEDKAELFWNKTPLRSPMGMALLPANDPRGDGIFVASKGKISLILDRDRDGRGDEEIIVASGWKEISHGVDTLGLAVDPKDGSIYFSIAVENFVDAYMRDFGGKAHYSLTSDRATVQRVAADFSKRETIATGVRFLCALAFNREGDLFATDQEGATWLPNGNPLDELLHIVKGRHYGFPPRHPKHLPDVIDEPPVMEYGPQHQSTVGMIFNESVNGGPVFGPANWEGDAIICGESRGKLYRTKLVKSREGYVADNHLIASLSLLTVDSCVTPKGDLIVACHSGPPDWGTGPAGEGRLFKIKYARKDVPQVARAWAASPDEFRIAFDRPMRAEDWAGAREKVRIEAGRHVNAGDRFESIRPGYQVVRDQMSSPRRWIECQSLLLSADHRTLILRIPRQAEAVNYAVALPTPEKWRAKGGLDQHNEIDVLINMNGVQAAVVADGATTRTILPHGNLNAARAFTKGSAEHEAFFAQLDKGSGKLELRTQIDDSNIFVPATQPGSTLDWDIAKDKFANTRMVVLQDYSSAQQRDVAVAKGLELSLPLPVNRDGAGLFFALNNQERPIRGERLRVPWAVPSGEKNKEPNVARTDLKGHWMRGKKLFFGAATCGTCHTVRGEGTPFGPDLSNLLFRDRESVIVDIAQPSATINPDHTGSLIKFKDGSELNGVVKTLNDQEIVLRMPAGVEEKRPRNTVSSIAPMEKSLMPDGLGEALSKVQMEDLLTFLLTNPLEPTRITRLDPPMPPARTAQEIAPFLTAKLAGEVKPIRILLCAGPKDHGVDEHDYPVWIERWSKLLALAEGVTISTNMGFPSADKLANADVAVVYSANPGWNLDAAKVLDDYQKRGGGLVYIHFGVEGHKEPLALAERIGLAFSFSAFRHGEMDLVFNDTSHPITKGFSKLRLIDETYWAMRGDVKRIHNLADSVEGGKPQPQLWTLEREKGRVFVSIPGHYMWTFDDPLFRIILLRGIAWAAREENVDRFNELATIGARSP